MIYTTDFLQINITARSSADDGCRDNPECSCPQGENQQVSRMFIPQRHGLQKDLDDRTPGQIRPDRKRAN